MTITLLLSVIFFSTLHHPSTATLIYNVMDFGAQPDGTTDSTDSFLAAWANACRSLLPSTLYVPNATFLLGAVSFQGPCNNNHTVLHNHGTLVAHSTFDVTSSKDWIAFDRVAGVLVHGGTIDGQGKDFWNYRSTFGKDSLKGGKSIVITNSKNMTIRSLTSINSKFFHMHIESCEGIRVERAHVMAPENSPNTDGIHTIKSRDVTIENSEIQTGDDCISINHGTVDLHINNVTCGPGHGISIGSLGNKYEEEGVQNITVTKVLLKGTQNGLRIKTWARPSTGFVNGVTFEHIKMIGVDHPIIIDQNYCPHPQHTSCPNMDSGIRISNVKYRNVEGTSMIAEAVQFSCSQTNPCREINLEEVNIQYQNQSAQSYCNYAEVFTRGLVIPPTCPTE